MTLMGVGAQNDLGGTKVLPEEWLESCLTNQSFFLSKLRWSPKKKGFHSNWDGISVQIVVISKKKKKEGLHSYLEDYFCPNWGDLQKKMVFTHIETVFLSSAQNILLGKLAQTTWNCPKFWRKIAQKIWNRPKFWCKIAQNIWNCP